MTLTKSYQTQPWIKTAEQLALYVANFDKRINQFDSTDDYSRLMAFILEWRMKLGIKDLPTSLDSEMCIKHIMELYSDMSMEDMRLAVKYSLQGLLKVDNRAFQSFSPIYISIIFNGYKVYKAHEINKVLKQKHEFETRPAPTQIDKLESRRKYMRWYIEEIKKDEGYVIDLKSIAYDVVGRYFISVPPLEQYLEEASKAIENESRIGNTFNRVIANIEGGSNIEKYQKYFALKETFSGLTIAWVDILSEFHLMGEQL